MTPRGQTNANADGLIVDLGAYLQRETNARLDPQIAAIVQVIADASAGLAEELGIGLTPAADARLIDALRAVSVQSVLSEAAALPVAIDPDAMFSVAMDPLDGSNNIAINAPIGTIFSIVPAVAAGEDPASAFLRTGRHLSAAGFVLYGPATMLVLTVGHGTHVFALDRTTGVFLQTRLDVRIPSGTREFAINASNYRHWDRDLRLYVDDLVAGADGPRGEDFNMRWVAALVADAYRIIVRGGIFLHPGDARTGYREGRLRLIYEAQPIAFLMEQAGGAAVDMGGPVLDRSPESLHARTPLVFGSRDKVERLVRYLREPQYLGERSPLFAQRGLLR
jgi:fructose-1,6-bisphosphatase I